MKGTKAKEGKNSFAPSKNKNTYITCGNQETKEKAKKSVKVDFEVAVKKSDFENSDGKDKNIKNKKKNKSKQLIDAADVSAVKEKEKKPKKKPVEQVDCTSNQEVTDRKWKKKALKNQLEEAKEVEEKQTEDRKQNKKDKKRKYEALAVTEGSGEDFTEVMQKKKAKEEANEASDEIYVTKKIKKAKTVVAEQDETEPLQDDPFEGDKVTQVKKIKSKNEKTQCVETVKIEEGVIKKKKKKAKSKKSETVEEEMGSEKKVKMEKSKAASVEEEVAVKKEKDQQMIGAEMEQQIVKCEAEQSERIKKVGEKKKKPMTKSSEEAAEENKCDTGTMKRKKNKEKRDKQKGSRQALQKDIDQGSQAAPPTKSQGFSQWSTAQFDSTDQQQKFLRLMGGFKKGFQPASGTTCKANMALGKDAQQQLQQGLLGQFEQAHSRRIDFGSRGAGLGFTAPSNKKFFIDVNASRSVRFDD